MKKRLQGINLVLMLMLIFAFACASIVSAAGTTAGGGVPAPTVTVTDTNNTVSIRKDLIFINDAATAVREPNTTYTYTLSAVDMSAATATVKDSDGMSGPVKSGVADAITTKTATITFASTATSATSEAGVTQTRYADFTFDLAGTKFPGPGIYRYKIVEANATKATVGIDAMATYNDTRYLDVYVKKTSETDDTPVIYGYVLFESDDSTISFDGTTSQTNIAKKSSGYVNTSNTASKVYTNVDVYRTQNVTINKTTTGLMADKNNDFPLTITFTAPADGMADIPVDVTLVDDATLAGTSSDAIGTYVTLVACAGELSGTVDNGSSISFIGVPEGATVSLVETNNTPDSYKVKAEATVGSTASTPLAEAIVAASATTGTFTALTMSSTTTIDLTNTLDTISPTGFITRFAPYVLLLVGGILLIVLGRKAVNSTKKKNA